MLTDDHVAEESLLPEASISEPDTHEAISEHDSNLKMYPGHGLSPVPVAVFRPCLITGPDGQPRKSWAMWIGNFCFGKADSKESLLACLARLQAPSNTFHWRSGYRNKSSKKRDVLHDQDRQIQDLHQMIQCGRSR
jgi:hypothetical protein